MIIVDKLPSVIIATHFPSIKAKSQSRYNPLGKQTLGLAEARRRFQGAPRSVVGSFESAGRLETGGICAERGARARGLPAAPRTTQPSPPKSRRKIGAIVEHFFPASTDFRRAVGPYTGRSKFPADFLVRMGLAARSERDRE